MTINEIEATLHTLEKRHLNLTEDTLLTLLKASSWEEKQIQEALAIFRVAHTLPEGHETSTERSPVLEKTNSPTSSPEVSAMVYYDSTGSEERKPEILTDATTIRNDIPIIKSGADLSYVQPKAVEKEPGTQAQPQPPKTTEPESLIIPTVTQTAPAKKVDPPGNLPLKPFESSDHVWPLSRYNDVFHGDVPPVLSRTEAKLVEEHKDDHKKEEPEKVVKLKRTGFDGEDEGLILLTGISLLIVLLLLAYMYSNGRL